jgi:hypothetical protein
MQQLEDMLRQGQDDPQKVAQIQKELEALKRRYGAPGKGGDGEREGAPEGRSGVLKIIIVGTLITVIVVAGFSVLNRYVARMFKKKTSDRVPAALQRQNTI